VDTLGQGTRERCDLISPQPLQATVDGDLARNPLHLANRLTHYKSYYFILYIALIISRNKLILFKLYLGSFLITKTFTLLILSYYIFRKIFSYILFYLVNYIIELNIN
jgi:hypothetical protein